MTAYILWIRMFANLLNALNFGIVAISLVMFLRRSDIGHRTMIRLAIIFCGMVTGDSAIGAWRVYQAMHAPHSPAPAFAMIRLGTAVFGTVCVTYFMVTNRDIIRTLRISELWTRLREDDISDAEQARINMEFVSSSNLQRTQALMMKH